MQWLQQKRNGIRLCCIENFWTFKEKKKLRKKDKPERTSEIAVIELILGEEEMM